MMNGSSNSLVLTAHDYRTPRKANMHFIADELAKRGPTRFFSLRYSALSKRTRDIRTFLDDRANTIERVDGVDCYLAKSWVHPFNTRRAWLRPVENALFRRASTHLDGTLVRWIREADTIFFESGAAVMYIDVARRLNPRARRIYIASDDLATINVADYLLREFQRVAPALDAVCLTSSLMASSVPRSASTYVVPHGLDGAIAEHADPSPYGDGVHAVSVGSMLFDRTFFEIAATAFPTIVFHVIGAGNVERAGLPGDVRFYDEMPHRETLRYIKHARFGIAPYRGMSVPAYLADTSMKMMQYRFFGVPAVAPSRVTGGAADRFGYEPGSPSSIRQAIERALRAPHRPSPSMLNWSEVTDRLIEPERFEDARLASVPPPPSRAA